MKERAQGIVIGIVITLALIGAISFASQHSEYIERVYRDIKITINGATIAPKDANGNDVEPFIVDGTTYLPVRAICNALGLQVTWDDETSTVELIDDGIGRINAIYEAVNKNINETSNISVNTQFGIENNNITTSVQSNTNNTQNKTKLSGAPTEMQKKALEDAKNVLNTPYLGYSKKNLISYLEGKYVNSEVMYVMEHLEVNWGEQAYKTAKFLSSDTKPSLRRLLQLYNFTDEDINYAIKKMGDHFKRCAAKYANSYNPDTEHINLENGSLTYYKMTFEEYMREKGYDDEEIAFAREELKYKQ